MKTNQGSKRASLSDTAYNNALATSSNSDPGYNAIDVVENNESGYDFLNADHENAFAPPTPSTPSTPSTPGDVFVGDPTPLVNSGGITTPSPPLERESQQKATSKLQGDVSTDNETSKRMKGLPFCQAVAAGPSQQADSSNANTSEPAQTIESLKKELTDLYHNFDSRESMVLELEEALKAKNKDNAAMRVMDRVHQNSITVLREAVASRNADVVSAEENVALHLKTIETLKQKSESRGDKISELKRRSRYHEEQEATMEQRQNQLILREFEAGRNERRMRARLVQAVQERNAALEELEFFFRGYLKTLADQDQFHGQKYEVEAEHVRRYMDRALGRAATSEQALEANRGRLAHDKKFHEQKYEIETERLRRHLNRALERAATSEQALEASRGRLAHDKQFLERKAEVETERLRRHLNRALQEARELQEENAKLKKEAAAAAQNGP